MDMLIKVFPDPCGMGTLESLAGKGIDIRRAMAYERRKVIGWIETHFSPGWADECAAAFGHTPVGCHIAVQETHICGFCCVHTTFKNFIGPVGVRQAYRRQGVGRGLLISVVRQMYISGFAYAVIGDVGAPEFFKRAVNAWEIPDSTPGAYPRKI